MGAWPRGVYSEFSEPGFPQSFIRIPGCPKDSWNGDENHCSARSSPLSRSSLWSNTWLPNNGRTELPTNNNSHDTNSVLVYFIREGEASLHAPGNSIRVFPSDYLRVPRISIIQSWNQPCGGGQYELYIGELERHMPSPYLRTTNFDNSLQVGRPNMLGSSSQNAHLKARPSLVISTTHT